MWEFSPQSFGETKSKQECLPHESESPENGSKVHERGKTDESEVHDSSQIKIDTTLSCHGNRVSVKGVELLTRGSNQI